MQKDEREKAGGEVGRERGEGSVLPHSKERGERQRGIEKTSKAEVQQEARKRNLSHPPTALPPPPPAPQHAVGRRRSFGRKVPLFSRGRSRKPEAGVQAPVLHLQQHIGIGSMALSKQRREVQVGEREKKVG